MRCVGKRVNSASGCAKMGKYFWWVGMSIIKGQAPTKMTEDSSTTTRNAPGQASRTANSQRGAELRLERRHFYSRHFREHFRLSLFAFVFLDLIDVNWLNSFGIRVVKFLISYSIHGIHYFLVNFAQDLWKLVLKFGIHFHFLRFRELLQIIS